MIVFTCVDKESEDAAVIWAASLQQQLLKGTGGVRTFIFHTADVDVSRFTDFSAFCVSVGNMEGQSKQEMLIRVLDMMHSRGFEDHVMYAHTDVLWQGDVEEIRNCPLDSKLWLAARNEHVYFDSKRNQKFYPMYDEDYQRKSTIAPMGYFNSDVMMLLISGLYRAVKRAGYASLEELYLAKKMSKGWSPTDTLNSLITEYINLFDRYNAFTEEYFELDFGEMLSRRMEIKLSKLVNFVGVHKPWRETSDFDLPELAGAMYPFHHYLQACDIYRTYITKDFYERVKANVHRYRMIVDWERDVLDAARPLKEKLEKFNDDLKQMMQDIKAI